MRRAGGVAVSLLLLSACTASPDPVQIPAPSARPTTAAPQHSAGSPEPPLAALPRGAPPAITYVAGRRLVVAGGPDVRLPGRRGASGAVSYAGGLLVADAVWFEGTNGLHLIVDGRPVRSWPSSRHCSSGSPAASTDGRWVAWVNVYCPESDDTARGVVHRARADGSAERTLPIGADLAHVVGLLGPRVVFNRAYRAAWIADFDGPPHRIRGVEAVQDVGSRTGRLIGRRGDRTRLVVDAGGRVQWRVRVGDLVSFSPDERRVLALLPGRRLRLLRAADGRPGRSVTLPRGCEAWTAVWETDRSLLVECAWRGRAAILRVRRDGRLERATAVVRQRGWPAYVLLPR